MLEGYTSVTVTEALVTRRLGITKCDVPSAQILGVELVKAIDKVGIWWCSNRIHVVSADDVKFVKSNWPV